MPNIIKLQRAETRATILRCTVAVFRAYYQEYFNTKKFGANIELGFILFAVCIGQAEARLVRPGR